MSCPAITTYTCNPIIMWYTIHYMAAHEPESHAEENDAQVANQPSLAEKELNVSKAVELGAKLFVDWPVQLIGIIPGIIGESILGGFEGAHRDDMSFFDGLAKGLKDLKKADVRRAWGLYTIAFVIANEKLDIVHRGAKFASNAFSVLAGESPK